MSDLSRKRSLAVPPDRVFDLVSSPRELRRWWPRVVRVESVEGSGKRARWTQVMEANSGRKLRVDYRCVDSSRPARYAWAQELEGTQFEQHLKRQEVLVEIEPEDGGSRVRLTSRQEMKGASRMAAPLMRRTRRQILESALDGLEQALDGGGAA